MKNLEKVIINFDNWSNPLLFKELILEDTTLSSDEVESFKDLWSKADDPLIWKDLDEILACKASQHLIRENYELSDEAIAKIVRALAFKNH